MKIKCGKRVFTLANFCSLIFCLIHTYIRIMALTCRLTCQVTIEVVLSPRKQCMESFLFVALGDGCVTGIQWVGVKDAATHSIMHRIRQALTSTHTQQRNIQPKMSIVPRLRCWGTLLQTLNIKYNYILIPRTLYTFSLFQYFANFFYVCLKLSLLLLSFSLSFSHSFHIPFPLPPLIPTPKLELLHLILFILG